MRVSVGVFVVGFYETLMSSLTFPSKATLNILCGICPDILEIETQLKPNFLANMWSDMPIGVIIYMWILVESSEFVDLQQGFKRQLLEAT